MRPIVFAAGILMFIMGACMPSPSLTPAPATASSPTPTASPTGTVTPTSRPTDTSTPTVESQPSETPSPTAIFTFPVPPVTVPPTRDVARTKLPTDTPTSTPTGTAELQPSETASITPTPTLACERETAVVQLSASAESLKVGDMVTVTVSVSNEGCVSLGLPQYRLYIQLGGTQSVLTPANPEPVVHYLAVAPGQADSADFELTAISSGQVTLTATVSYEVHLGYPGPAYWGMTGSNQPLIITVEP